MVSKLYKVVKRRLIDLIEDQHMEQETVGCYWLFIKDFLYQLKGTKFINI